MLLLSQPTQRPWNCRSPRTNVTNSGSLALFGTETSLASDTRTGAETWQISPKRR
jgi:hypothetical protein